MIITIEQLTGKQTIKKLRNRMTKMIKPNIFKTNNYRIILFFLLLFTSNFLFSQGDDPWLDQTSIFEESDLYIDAYTTKSRPIYHEDPVSAGGYLGIGIGSNAPAKQGQDPRQMNGAPPPPPCIDGFTSGGTPCSSPINTEILYLIAAGLIYGAYKSRRKLAN